MSDLGWPLRRAARLYGDAVALRVEGAALTYRDLAARLARLDLAPGARVGVLAANTRAHVEAWLGVPAAGGVVVSLNYRLAPDELRVIAEDAELSMLITDRDVDLGCELRRVGGPRLRHSAPPRRISRPTRSPRSPTPAAPPAGRRA